jgi:hypothetical protein
VEGSVHAFGVYQCYAFRFRYRDRYRYRIRPILIPVDPDFDFDPDFDVVGSRVPGVILRERAPKKRFGLRPKDLFSAT